MANNDALNLRVIMGTTITPIRVKKDLAVPFILDELRARNPDRFRDVRMGPYMLHLLKTPIPIPKNIKDAGFISACFDPTNWTVVDERYDVDDLFEEPPPRKHIHLVIAIGDKTEIERGLAQHQAQLYKLLQVSVQELGRWTAYDVEDNGGRWIRDWSQAPQALKETVIKLKLKRNYVPTFATAEIQEAQRILGPQFQNVFNESWETQPNSVKSPGEFKVFSAAISLFVEEYSQRVKLDRSPALKASVFASFLIIPPAFESEIDHLVSYKQFVLALSYLRQGPWSCPLHIHPQKRLEFGIHFPRLPPPYRGSDIHTERGG
ncbi:hypothetical protein BOTBODRAFT_263134 [Botryobasidium botryosum FD-172 SS1]|uniref:Uncharacterized protein n=1 Tax=Botryobasidium botryosum (strain FD-172 SS1) TaxID=930990 RepID=A0A067LT58_BOTB1|nr:hypothetical protein BOTBODRAFT_263134 [Botryobasidium botryosum FD-172 SS1]